MVSVLSLRRRVLRQRPGLEAHTARAAAFSEQPHLVSAGRCALLTFAEEALSEDVDRRTARGASRVRCHGVKRCVDAGRVLVLGARDGRWLPLRRRRGVRPRGALTLSTSTAGARPECSTRPAGGERASRTCP